MGNRSQGLSADGQEKSEILSFFPVWLLGCTWVHMDGHGVGHCAKGVEVR